MAGDTLLLPVFDTASLEGETGAISCQIVPLTALDTPILVLFLTVDHHWPLVAEPFQQFEALLAPYTHSRGTVLRTSRHFHSAGAIGKSEP